MNTWSCEESVWRCRFNGGKVRQKCLDSLISDVGVHFVTRIHRRSSETSMHVLVTIQTQDACGRSDVRISPSHRGLCARRTEMVGIKLCRWSLYDRVCLSVRLCLFPITTALTTSGRIPQFSISRKDLAASVNTHFIPTTTLNSREHYFTRQTMSSSSSSEPPLPPPPTPAPQPATVQPQDPCGFPRQQLQDKQVSTFQTNSR